MTSCSTSDSSIAKAARPTGAITSEGLGLGIGLSGPARAWMTSCSTSDSTIANAARPTDATTSEKICAGARNVARQGPAPALRVCGGQRHARRGTHGQASCVHT